MGKATPDLWCPVCQEWAHDYAWVSDGPHREFFRWDDEDGIYYPSGEDAGKRCVRVCLVCSGAELERVA